MNSAGGLRKFHTNVSQLNHRQCHAGMERGGCKEEVQKNGTKVRRKATEGSTWVYALSDNRAELVYIRVDIIFSWYDWERDMEGPKMTKERKGIV